MNYGDRQVYGVPRVYREEGVQGGIARYREEGGYSAQSLSSFPGRPGDLCAELCPVLPKRAALSSFDSFDSYVLPGTALRAVLDKLLIMVRRTLPGHFLTNC